MHTRNEVTLYPIQESGNDQLAAQAEVSASDTRDHESGRAEFHCVNTSKTVGNNSGQ